MRVLAPKGGELGEGRQDSLLMLRQVCAGSNVQARIQKASGDAHDMATGLRLTGWLSRPCSVNCQRNSNVKKTMVKKEICVRQNSQTPNDPPV